MAPVAAKRLLKRSMSLYGNDRMRRHFPFVLRLCAVLVRALPLEAEAANCAGSESAARSRGVSSTAEEGV